MTETPDPYDIVEQYWPYDGPHSDETVVSALQMAGLLIRYANNATQYKSSLPWVATVYRAVGQLHGAVSGLDQLTSQLVTALENHADDPTLYDDRREAEHPAREVALTAAALLERSVEPIADLAKILGQAAQPLSHLGNN